MSSTDMPLALEAGDDLAQRDGVLHVRLERIAHRSFCALEGGADLEQHDVLRVRGKQRRTGRQGQAEEYGDRADDAELERHGEARA